MPDPAGTPLLFCKTSRNSPVPAPFPLHFRRSAQLRWRGPETRATRLLKGPRTGDHERFAFIHRRRQWVGERISVKKRTGPFHLAGKSELLGSCIRCEVQSDAFPVTQGLQSKTKFRICCESAWGKLWRGLRSSRRGRRALRWYTGLHLRLKCLHPAFPTLCSPGLASAACMM